MEVSATIISNRNDYKLIALLSIDSTNNYAAKLPDDGLVSEYTVIMAHNQTDGRGQRGSSWEVEANKNLTVSIVVRNLSVPVDNQFSVSMAVALSIHDCFRWLIKKPIHLKWPNDIYVDGCKLGGVLIENSMFGNTITKSIIGVGLNVNQRDFPKHMNATSLLHETEGTFTMTGLLDQWIPHLKKRMINLDFNILKVDYLKRLLWKGVKQTYEYKGVEVEATIMDVNKNGHLVLVTTGGKRIEAEIKEIKKI